MLDRQSRGRSGVSRERLLAQVTEHTLQAELYDLIAGEPFGERNRAARLTERIEDDLMQRGWSAGHVIGSEKELLARYRVGRNVLRQALSILEMRGIGKVRRGPAGGLLVSKGDWQGLVTFLANYLRWIGTTADDVARTQRLIAETDRRASASLVGGRLPWTALGPYSLVMETLAACRNDAEIKLPLATAGAHLNRLAARVVTQLAREITHERCVDGAYLGSIQQLSDRYGLDRRTLAQAIRLIADFDVLDIQRGRNGGLFLRTPRSEAIVRLVHGPLLALRLPLGETHALVWMLNCIHARAAAERGIVTPEIRSSLENLQRTHGEQAGFFWIRLQRDIAAAACLPALHLFSRCFSAYTIRAASPDQYQEPDTRMQELSTLASTEVVEAIAEGDPDAAEAAQARCHRLIDEAALAVTH